MTVRRGRRQALIAVVLVALGGAVVSASEVKVKPSVTSDGRVVASATVRDAWTLSTRQVLQTGFYTLSFAYEIELRKPQPLLLGLADKTLARVRVTLTAKFDTLTGAYTVQRLRDGRLVDSKSKPQEADARDWLTTVEQVELDPISPLEPNADYYVHVRLTISPNRTVSLWSLVPFGPEENAGREYFTYIVR